MPAPRSINEALSRANGLTPEQYLNRLAKGVSENVRNLSDRSLEERRQILALAAPDLPQTKEIEPVNYSEDDFIATIGQILSSTSGLSQLSSLRRTLMYVSSNDEKLNVAHVKQLLAWLLPEKERKTLGNMSLITLSKVEQLPGVIYRSVRTPIKDWEELKDRFEIGGGLRIRNDFAETPIGVIFDIVEQLLREYLALYDLALKAGRMKNDTRLEAVIYCRMTKVTAQISAADLADYNKAKQMYDSFSSELDLMQKTNSTEKGSEGYYKRLAQLTRNNEQAQKRYHKYQMKVETNPGKVDSALGSLREALQIADSYAANEVRFYDLMAIFRRKAVMTVNQAILMIVKASEAYSNHVVQENRLLQEKAINDNETALKRIVEGIIEGIVEKPLDRDSPMVIDVFPQPA